MKKTFIFLALLFAGLSAFSQRITGSSIALLKGDSVSTGAVDGRMYYDTGLHKWRFRENGAWKLLGSGAGSTIWGALTGTLSDQTDLQAALDSKEAHDTDLTTIAGLTPSNDDVLQRKSGAWINRSMAQLKVDLNLSGTNTGDQTNITGNAGSANVLSIPRTISLTGDVTYTSTGFDGSGNATGAASVVKILGNTIPANAAGVLTNDGAGNLTWGSGGGGGTVTSVTGTSNRITITGTATINPTVDIAATYVGQTSITTLGTLTTGTWSATAIGATKGGTAQTTWATGDLLYASATNTLSKLAISTDGKFLQIVSGIPSWTFITVDGVTITGDGSSGNPLTATATSGALLNVNNLGDVSSIGLSRQNLGALASEYDIVADAGSSRTLAASDFPPTNTGKVRYLITTNASPHTIAIPNDATMTLPIGSVIWGENDNGAGTLTFSATAPATVTGTSGGLLAPSPGFSWALIKTAANTWRLKNSGTPLGSANQFLAVDATGTSQEYKTASNGLVAAAGTLKFGGALTADTQLSGAFSLGLGVAPSAKLHIQGLGTGTGELIRFTDNTAVTPLIRLNILDNGKFTWTSDQSGAGITAMLLTAGVTATANSQTLTAFDLLINRSYGAFTGITDNLFTIRDNTAANPFMQIVQGTSSTSFVFNSAALYDFKNSSSTSLIRNSAAAIRFSGGTSSTATMLEFQPVLASSTAANVTFNFTGNTHNYGSAVTRTNSTMLFDNTITSVNGSTLTYKLLRLEPTITIGTSTITWTGLDYNPTFSTGTITAHYAALFRSGNIGIADNTPAEKLSVAGNVKLFHIMGASTAPSVAAGTGAGTSPTVVVSNATDASGVLDVTTGTTPAGTNAIIATVTFNTAYGVAPNVIITANNANAAGLMAALTAVYVTSTTTTFVLTSGTTALTAATQYKWYYHVIQ